jgi:hypothetical protein
MQGFVMGTYKKRASTPKYVSPNQLSFEGFETPFEQNLDSSNRWLVWSKCIPWDSIVGIYDRLFNSIEGRPPINGRVVIGSLIVKHFGALSDRETVAQIQENIYIQYFLGYSSFTTEPPFSPSLFVEFRKRLSEELIGKISDIVSLQGLKMEREAAEALKNPNARKAKDQNQDNKTQNTNTNTEGINEEQSEDVISEPQEIQNSGKLLMDATVAPQNITYPTDLKLLNAAREKSEQIIDKLFNLKRHPFKKPRTYRNTARKEFLNVAKKKRKSKNVIRRGNGKQLRYLKRNLGHIANLLTYYDRFPLKYKDLKYLMVLHTVYDQQNHMHSTKTHQVDNRIVNIHQPYVRPIVRGKEKAKTEFGSKLQISLVEGYTFLDHSSWDAYNESSYLIDSVEKYKNKFGFYPQEVHADQIYCTRLNRKELKERSIKLIAKPLGRPSATAVKNHLRPGERNPIEGKFGQAKIRYGLDNIKAKLADTSTSWIATIALVLNLVRMTRRTPLSVIVKIWEWLRLYLNRMICNNINFNYNIFGSSY